VRDLGTALGETDGWRRNAEPGHLEHEAFTTV